MPFLPIFLINNPPLKAKKNRYMYAPSLFCTAQKSIIREKKCLKMLINALSQRGIERYVDCKNILLLFWNIIIHIEVPK